MSDKKLTDAEFDAAKTAVHRYIACENVDNEMVRSLTSFLNERMTWFRQKGGKAGWNIPSECPPEKLIDLLSKKLMDGQIIDSVAYLGMIRQRTDVYGAFEDFGKHLKKCQAIYSLLVTNGWETDPQRLAESHNELTAIDAFLIKNEWGEGLHGVRNIVDSHNRLLEEKKLLNANFDALNKVLERGGIGILGVAGAEHMAQQLKTARQQITQFANQADAMQTRLKERDDELAELRETLAAISDDEALVMDKSASDRYPDNVDLQRAFHEGWRVARSSGIKADAAAATYTNVAGAPYQIPANHVFEALGNVATSMPVEVWERLKNAEGEVRLKIKLDTKDAQLTLDRMIALDKAILMLESFGGTEEGSIVKYHSHRIRECFNNLIVGVEGNGVIGSFDFGIASDQAMQFADAVATDHLKPMPRSAATLYNDAHKELDAWTCGECHGKGWNDKDEIVNHGKEIGKEAFRTKVNCVSCDGLGWLGRLGSDAQDAADESKHAKEVAKEPAVRNIITDESNYTNVSGFGRVFLGIPDGSGGPHSAVEARTWRYIKSVIKGALVDKVGFHPEEPKNKGWDKWPGNDTVADAMTDALRERMKTLPTVTFGGLQGDSSLWYHLLNAMADAISKSIEDTYPTVRGHWLDHFSGWEGTNTYSCHALMKLSGRAPVKGE